MSVGGTGVSVGGIGVDVGGTGVSVGGTGVDVGGIVVAVAVGKTIGQVSASRNDCRQRAASFESTVPLWS